MSLVHHSSCLGVLPWDEPGGWWRFQSAASPDDVAGAVPDAVDVGSVAPPLGRCESPTPQLGVVDEGVPCGRSAEVCSDQEASGDLDVAIDVEEMRVAV